MKSLLQTQMETMKFPHEKSIFGIMVPEIDIFQKNTAITDRGTLYNAQMEFYAKGFYKDALDEDYKYQFDKYHPILNKNTVDEDMQLARLALKKQLNATSKAVMLRCNIEANEFFNIPFKQEVSDNIDKLNDMLSDVENTEAAYDAIYDKYYLVSNLEPDKTMDNYICGSDFVLGACPLSIIIPITDDGKMIYNTEDKEYLIDLADNTEEKVRAYVSYIKDINLDKASKDSSNIMTTDCINSYIRDPKEISDKEVLSYAE